MMKKILVFMSLLISSFNVSCGYEAHSHSAHDNLSVYVETLINGHLYNKRTFRRWGSGLTALVLGVPVFSTSPLYSGVRKIINSMKESNTTDGVSGLKLREGMAFAGIISSILLALYSIKEFSNIFFAENPNKISDNLNKNIRSLLLDISSLGCANSIATTSISINDLTSKLFTLGSLLQRFQASIFILQSLIIFEKHFENEGFNSQGQYAASFANIETSLTEHINAVFETLLAKLSSLSDVTSNDIKVQDGRINTKAVINLDSIEKEFCNKYPLCTADYGFSNLQDALFKIRSQITSTYTGLRNIYSINKQNSSINYGSALVNSQSMDYALGVLAQLHKALQASVEFVEETKKRHAENILQEELNILEAQKQQTIAEANERNAEALRKKASADKLNAEKNAQYVHMAGDIVNLITGKPSGSKDVNINITKKNESPTDNNGHGRS